MQIEERSELDQKKYNVFIKCLPEEVADALIKAVNSKTGMIATMNNPEDAFLDVFYTLSKKAENQLEKHKIKIKEIEDHITAINSEKGNKQGQSLEDFERRQLILKPLQNKLEELQKQKDEFSSYMHSFQVRLNLLKGRATKPDKEIIKIRMEFGLERSKFESALPMYSRKTDITNTVLNNKVSIVLGETGSGKSTQMLQYLYDAGLSERGTIVCTQPRKIAATSLASRVAQEMDSAVGGLVGFHVGMKAKRGPATRLLYVTDQVLLNECLKDQLFAKFSCIIIDEAHERSINTDLLLGFIKRALFERDDLKVIITSATIDPQVFVDFFFPLIPPVLTISGRAFPVDVHYEDSFDDDYVSLAANKSLQVHKSESIGDILVFLTNPIETEKASKFLRERNDEDMLVLELHGKLQIEDQQKIFETTPHRKRKIVFATNSAETSITIPGVKYVIDTGRVREMIYDPKRNMSALVLTMITRSSAAQRKGRAGRTNCGKCFRLYTEKEYDELRPTSVPEILRVHLG